MCTVTKYDCDIKEFLVKDQNIIIKEDGVYWFAQDANRSEMEHGNIKMIQDGIEIHQSSEGRVKSHHQ